MIRRFTLFFFIVLLTNLITAQTQQMVYPQDYTTDWIDIYIGENGGSAMLGTCGYMAFSDDGQNWNVQQTPSESPFRQLTCLPGTNCQTVMLTTSSSNTNTLALSTDGGQNWTFTTNEGFYTFVDHPDHIGQISQDEYRYTTDGVNWTNVDLPVQPRSVLVFVDAQFGYYGSATDNQLVITTDGGQSWTETGHELPIFNPSTYFQDRQNGWVLKTGFRNEIYQTTDGGENWNLIQEEFESFALTMIGTGDENLFIWGFDSIIYSVDGGATLNAYSYIDRGSQGTFSTRPAFQRDQEIWLPGNAGQLFYTTDLTEPVVPLFSNLRPEMEDVLYASNSTAYTVTNEGQIFKSTDAGENWSLLPVSPGASLTQIERLNNGGIVVRSLETGWQRSINGGDSWQALVPEPIASSLSLEYQAFIQAPGGRLHIFSDSTSIYSDNNGATWTTVEHGVAQRGTAMEFKNENEGIVIGNNNMFHHRTTDGGESWTMVSTGEGDAPTNPTDIIFLENDRIIATGESSYFLSDDDGMSWTRSGSFRSAKNIVQAADGTLYLTGDRSTRDGQVYRSLDQGTTWEPLGEHYCARMQRIALSPNELYLLSVGLGGTIVRSDLPGLLSGTESPRVSERPLEIFPNPVSNQQLNLLLPTETGSKEWSIGVYDLQGRRVLRAETVELGEQWTVDLPNLSTGMYFVRLLGEDGYFYVGRVVVE